MSTKTAEVRNGEEGGDVTLDDPTVGVKISQVADTPCGVCGQPIGRGDVRHPVYQVDEETFIHGMCLTRCLESAEEE